MEGLDVVKPIRRLFVAMLLLLVSLLISPPTTYSQGAVAPKQLLESKTVSSKASSMGQRSKTMQSQSAQSATKVSPTRPAFVQGEVLVKYKMSASSVTISSLNASLGSTKIKNIGRTGVEQLKVRAGLSVENAIVEYQNQPEVEFAEPNYIYHIDSTTPNDTSYSKLWGLNNTGQTVNGTTGTSDADIDAPEAWDITTGSSSVIVAVIDSGVDY